MSFKFPGNVEIVLFTAGRAKNAAAFYLRAAVARTTARHNADKENEVAGSAGMEASPTLPLGIEVEAPAHEKAPRGKDGSEGKAEHNGRERAENHQHQAAAAGFFERCYGRGFHRGRFQ